MHRHYCRPVVPFLVMASALATPATAGDETQGLLKLDALLQSMREVSTEFRHDREEYMDSLAQYDQAIGDSLTRMHAADPGTPEFEIAEADWAVAKATKTDT